MWTHSWKSKESCIFAFILHRLPSFAYFWMEEKCWLCICCVRPEWLFYRPRSLLRWWFQYFHVLNRNRNKCIHLKMTLGALSPMFLASGWSSYSHMVLWPSFLYSGVQLEGTRLTTCPLNEAPLQSYKYPRSPEPFPLLLTSSLWCESSSLFNPSMLNFSWRNTAIQWRITTGSGIVWISVLTSEHFSGILTSLCSFLALNLRLQEHGSDQAQQNHEARLHCSSARKKNHCQNTLAVILDRQILSASVNNRCAKEKVAHFCGQCWKWLFSEWWLKETLPNEKILLQHLALYAEKNQHCPKTTKEKRREKKQQQQETNKQKKPKK